MSTAKQFAYESMGTHWAVTIWDDIDLKIWNTLQATIIARSQEFDQAYSRFIKTSLVWELTHKTGVVDVPTDLVNMLRLYEKLNTLSGGKFTPLIGFTLSDLGYDAQYSLAPQTEIRKTPHFAEALRIIDNTHIELLQSVLIDVGALGKGYFVDMIAEILRGQGLKRFLVNGSGDIYYQGNGESIRAGLEHPDDPSKAIGVVNMTQGSLCGSGGNRRTWNNQHHIIDPTTGTSDPHILATWVIADTAALADGLATCIFLCDPEVFAKDCAFEYCILNDEYKIKRSTGFTAELF